MSLNYVTLLITSQDAANDATAGLVSITPTSEVVAAGVTVVSEQAVVRSLAGGQVSVKLVATDNTGTSPASRNWSYQILLPGETTPLEYYVDFANGASQRLDNLTPLNGPPAVLSAVYLPLPGGNPSAGQVPIATGTGEASVWGSPGAASLPLTTLGDTLYEDATPTPVRLPGNTTSTRKFLRQTGTGSVSAAPAWDTLVPGDIPALSYIPASAEGAPGGVATLDGSGHVPAAQLALAALAANNLSDLASASTARTNLGLGSAATQPSTAFVAKAGDTMGGKLAPKVVTLTDAATIAVDASAGNELRVTLGGNRTMGAPSNATDGQTVTFEVVQDATGSRTVTWTGGTGGYSFGAGSAPALSTAAHAVDLVAFRYSAAAGNSAGAWCYLGSGLGF